jgi:LmbE family N-acetylglucosaminyl deacetylase
MSAATPVSPAGGQRTVVLSPHLDDAVLSAWYVLTSTASVTVVTVFAGVPKAGFVTDLDRHLGATESAARVQQRRAEDRAALATLGADHVHLDLLDAQYPAHATDGPRQRIAALPADFVTLVADEPGLRTDPDTILNLVRPYLDTRTTVYAPAGVGRHPDHRDLARAAICLAGSVQQLWLYADLPYHLRHGLPSWITQQPNDAADRLTEAALADLGLTTSARGRTVVTLTADQLDRKWAALRTYTTEYPTLAGHFHRSPTQPRMAGYEVRWQVPPSTMPG